MARHRRSKTWIVWAVVVAVVVFFVAFSSFILGDSPSTGTAGNAVEVRLVKPRGAGNKGKSAAHGKGAAGPTIPEIQNPENFVDGEQAAKDLLPPTVPHRPVVEGDADFVVAGNAVKDATEFREFEPLYPGTGSQARTSPTSGHSKTCFIRNYSNVVFEAWPRNKVAPLALDDAQNLHIPEVAKSYFSTKSCHVMPRSFIALLQFWFENVQTAAKKGGSQLRAPIVYDRYIGGIADRLKGIYNAFLIALVTKRPFVVRYIPRKSLPFDEGFVSLLSDFPVSSRGCPLTTIDRDAPHASQVYAECDGHRGVSSNVQWIDSLMKDGSLKETVRHIKKNYGDELITFISEFKARHGTDDKEDDLVHIRPRNKAFVSSKGSSWGSIQAGAGPASIKDKFWEQLETEIGPMRGVRLTYLSACLIDSFFTPTPDMLSIIRKRADKLLPPAEASAMDSPKCTQRKPLVCIQVRYGKTRDYVDPQYVNDNGNEQLSEFFQQQLQAHEAALAKDGVSGLHLAPKNPIPTALPHDKLLEPNPRPPFFFQTLPEEDLYDGVAIGNPKQPVPFCLFITGDVADFQRKMNQTIGQHFSQVFDPSCSIVDVEGSVHIAKSHGIRDGAMSSLGADFLFLRYCTKTMVTGDSGFGGLALGLKARQDAILNDFWGMHRDPSPSYFRRYYQKDHSKW